MPLFTQRMFVVDEDLPNDPMQAHTRIDRMHNISQRMIVGFGSY